MTSNGRDGLSTEAGVLAFANWAYLLFIAALVGGVFALDYLTPAAFQCGFSISCRLSSHPGRPIPGAHPSSRRSAPC